MDAHKYTYRVTWSAEDEEYVGLCAEFPSLSWMDKSQEKAFMGIVSLVCGIVEDMKSNGETVPVPLSERKYSGHFVVRTTPETHRKLAMQAAEAGVSLNRLVNSLF
ncbi:MAG: toxin-antitoxin system HicB family antitoxin [Mailhella sp.]|nr:toxin-antitoxin system HicB family antitoxin [Mailhella sp.]